MERITLSHGSGGRAMHELIDSLFMKELDNKILREKRDSAVFDMEAKRIAFTTDSYVVNPIFFPGGDIGSLAIYGTVNDLAVCGAEPLYIALGLIIEEGFEKDKLERLAGSIRLAAKKAGVEVVTGDTKVVEKGSCDSIFITTSGIGEVYYESLSQDAIQPGDAVVVSGQIGEHAVSILSQREGISFKSKITSDSAPLNGIIKKVLESSRKVRFMRDPTRGGLATTLNEIATGRKFGIWLDERQLPIREGVRQACELLGFDPLYLACEGRFVAIVAAEDAQKVLKIMRQHPQGDKAKVIGKVTGEHKGKVYLNTVSGGRRILSMLSGEQLPRIC